MLNIRRMNAGDKAVVVAMDEEFYSGPAVDHTIPQSQLAHTFDCAVQEHYPLDGFILEDESGIAGFAYTSMYHATDVAGLCVMIEEIFIKADRRSMGYGPLTLQFIFEQYPQAKRFRLEVTKENGHAMHVYEKNGFAYIGYNQMYKD